MAEARGTMPAVYVSSTYMDLKDYRQAVIDALRQINVHAVGMEDYSAADQRPLHKCLEDVDKADIYIGIFAWKYGYVPSEGNPAGKSITELEYRRALAGNKPCLIFLLDENEPWPLARVDRGDALEQVTALRDDAMQRHLVKFFRQPQDLVNVVLAAVHNELSRRASHQGQDGDVADPDAGDAAGGLPKTTGLKRALRGHSDAVESVALSTDARIAASGSWDKAVRLWDLEDGRPLRALLGHTGTISHPGIVYGVAISPDASQVISCGYDGTIRIWDAQDGRELRRLNGHKGAVVAIALSADGRRLVSAGSDRSVRVWDMVSYYEVCQLTGHVSQPRSIAVSEDGRTAVSGGADQGMFVWDLINRGQARRLTQPTSAVFSVDLSPDATLALTAEIDGAIQLWDVETGREIRRFLGHEKTVRRAVISADMSRVLSGGNDATMRLWDLSSGAELERYEEHASPVVALAISRDGKVAVSGAADGVVRVWDLP